MPRLVPTKRTLDQRENDKNSNERHASSLSSLTSLTSSSEEETAPQKQKVRSKKRTNHAEKWQERRQHAIESEENPVAREMKDPATYAQRCNADCRLLLYNVEKKKATHNLKMYFHCQRLKTIKD